MPVILYLLISSLARTVWHHHHTRVGQCGTTITTPVLASAAPPSPHLCWPVWHHHHICVGLCGTITTFVLANVAPSSHLCWPMWHHHHICVGLCGTTATPVLANVAPPPHLCWPMWHHHHTESLLQAIDGVMNDDKTEALLFPFSSSLKPSTVPLPDSITLGSRNIPFSDSARNLGFILGSKLSMKKHVTKICQIAYFSRAH